MECGACIRVCPDNALEMDEGVLCVKLEGRPLLRVDEEKCTKCNLCNEICPMSDIALSAVGCSSCIICKGKSSCIIPDDKRVSFLNFIVSITRFTVLMQRIIFQYFRARIHGRIKTKMTNLFPRITR